MHLHDFACTFKLALNYMPHCDFAVMKKNCWSCMGIFVAQVLLNLSVIFPFNVKHAPFEKNVSCR